MNNNKKVKEKSFSFQSSSRAEYAYKKAVDIINAVFFMNGEDLVKLQGNVVTVPEWFPFSAN